MSSRAPTDWMWARACALIDEAERMHRQFFRLTTSERMQAMWEPPADVFEDALEIVVVVALPGVALDRVEVTSEPGALLVRAERPVPVAGSRYALRQLEIPYGRFERRIPLPDAQLETGTRQMSDGCLILRLRKAT
jgi:HSP20 family molecular chaperone IbpA